MNIKYQELRFYPTTIFNINVNMNPILTNKSLDLIFKKIILFRLQEVGKYIVFEFSFKKSKINAQVYGIYFDVKYGWWNFNVKKLHFENLKRKMRSWK